jgi:hypothetical protein
MPCDRRFRFLNSELVPLGLSREQLAERAIDCHSPAAAK